MQLQLIKLEINKVLKNNLFFRIIIFLAFFCLFIFLLKDAIFLSQGNLDFTISPQDGIKNLFYTWREGNNFGNNNSNVIWQLFPLAILYYFFNLIGINAIYTQIIIFALLFTCGFIFFGILFRIIFSIKDFLTTFIASLFYVFNFYVITLISDNTFFIFITYAFFPLQIYLFIKGINEKQWIKYLIILSLINILTFGVNLIYDFILLFVYIVYVLFIYANKKEKFLKSIKFLFWTCLITLLLTLWWFLPYFLSNFVYKINTNYILDSEHFQNYDTSPIQVFRNFGAWFFFSSYKGTPYVEFASKYKNNIFLSFLSFIIPLIVLLSSFFKKNSLIDRKKIIILLSLIVFLLPIIGGINEFWFSSDLISKIFENIPILFIFRNTYKFMSLVCLIYSLLLGYVFFEFLKNKSKFFKIFSFFVIIGVIIFMSFPFFLGNIFSSRAKINTIPDYWKNAQEYFFKEETPRILLLPDQYFNIFNWDEKIQTSRASFSDTLLKTENIYKTCNGCGMYYSNKAINFVYDNLDSESIDELLSLWGISNILQRNDFDYKFYNSKSPEEIKKNLNSNSNIEMSSSFGMLDLYKINNTHVSAKFYSPKYIFSAKDIDDFFDILNFSNKDILIVTEESLNNIFLKNNSIFLKKIFKQDNLVENNTITSILNLPKSGQYEILNCQESVNNFLNVNNGFKINNCNFSLPEGNLNFEKKLFIEKNNLLKNFSFESGLWTKEVGNCKLTDRMADIRMEISSDASDGKNSLYLFAKKDMACTKSNAINLQNKEQEFLFSFDYKIKSGNAGFCLWDGKKCIVKYFLNKENENWNTYTMAFSPNKNSNTIIIYLYSLPNEENSGSVFFDNIKLNNINNNYNSSNLIIKSVDSKKFNNLINYKKINPTLYNIEFNLEDNNGVFVFNESFHPGWKAFIQENGMPKNYFDHIKRFLGLWRETEIDEKNHFLANGFSNGWVIDQDINTRNKLQIIVEFYPQKCFYLGLIISGLTLLFCICCLLHYWKRNKFKHSEKNYNKN
ncbi:MAG: alpha-(1-_3)-arabinofuranosyltransferase family protein [Candidatus Paceibacterota bacterium]